MCLLVVEIELVLAAVCQIKDADYEPVSAHLVVLIVIIKYFVQSLRFFVPLGEVPDLLQQLRVGDGRVEVLV